VRILVVAAHPDDEALGCGATTARHAAAGDEVSVLILGEGITSRAGLSAARRKAELARLHAAARRASKAMGVAKLTLERFPDNSFDTVARLKLVHRVETEIDAWKPEVVYTHSAADLNVDHQLTCEAVKTATRPIGRDCPRRVLTFEVPSATEWRFDAARSFRPQVFVDVEATLEAKLAALAAYGGEMRPFPHPRSAEYVRALAAWRGSQSGCKAAEAFTLVRDVER
jgi:LmbE family N-acetylglucosaminyl deacetylase